MKAHSGLTELCAEFWKGGDPGERRSGRGREEQQCGTCDEDGDAA